MQQFRAQGMVPNFFTGAISKGWILLQRRKPAHSAPMTAPEGKTMRNSTSYLPEAIGIEWQDVEPGLVRAKLVVTKSHMAPNGFLHAASVIGLVDSACGFGCMSSRPDGAHSFTTLELKANFLGSAREGETVSCVARLVHGGRTTQVWDAEATNDTTGKTIALFRCTQLLLYPKP
jgi:1,4-dihydroxy-2-naphthoyl-CoA hydrolase